MPLTNEELANRREGLGASDMATVLGLNPFQTAYDLMLEKRGLLEPDQGKPWLSAGNLLEPAIINWARTILGPIDTPQEAFRDPKGSCLFAHPDGIVVATGRPVEAKSHLQFNDEHWGEAGTDDIPERVLVQGTTQLICNPNKPDTCHVIALLPVRLFAPFVVRYDADFADLIRWAADDFWKLKESGGWPEAAPSASIIKRIKREPKSVATVSVESFVRARDTRQARLDAEKIEEAAWVALAGEMGTAEAATCEAGMLTYMAQRGKPRLDEALLETEHPGLLDQYRIETVNRVKRFKK